jgi:hypothetical protein
MGVMKRALQMAKCPTLPVTTTASRVTGGGASAGRPKTAGTDGGNAAP